MLEQAETVVVFLFVPAVTSPDSSDEEMVGVNSALLSISLVVVLDHVFYAG